MASYELQWKTSALKDLKNIDPKQISRIIKTVESLGDNPFPRGHRKLRGAERFYRIRVGAYRVVYEVKPKLKRVTIFYVRHRSDVYRR